MKSLRELVNYKVFSIRTTEKEFEDKPDGENYLMDLFKHTRRGTGSLLGPVIESETMVHKEIFF